MDDIDLFSDFQLFLPPHQTFEDRSKAAYYNYVTLIFHGFFVLVVFVFILYPFLRKYWILYYLYLYILYILVFF